jgi:putative ABC transport system substrate-binding protein
MAASTDPVARGLAANLSRPGRNITGLSIQAGPEIDAKRLQLLKDCFPKVTRVAFLGTRSEWDLPNQKALREAADTLGVTLLLAEHTVTTYADAFALIVKEKSDALFLSLTPVAEIKTIIDFAFEHRLPATYPWRQNVVDGGLMSYGVDLQEQYRRTADYVHRILNGEKPGELPIQQPAKFELVINIKTARALGLEIPPMLIARADELIE